MPPRRLQIAEPTLTPTPAEASTAFTPPPRTPRSLRGTHLALTRALCVGEIKRGIRCNGSYENFLACRFGAPGEVWFSGIVPHVS